MDCPKIRKADLSPNSVEVGVVTKMMRADELPKEFRIETTWEDKKTAKAYARRVGAKIGVEILGHEVFLRPDQRVRVVEQ